MRYFDTSAIASLFIPDVHTAAVRRHVRKFDSQFAASALCRLELSSTVSRHARMETIDQPDALAVLREADAWFESHGEMKSFAIADWAVADRIVRRFELKLRAPDALHIALCLRDALTLVTFDHTQAKAAEAVGVETIIPMETDG